VKTFSSFLKVFNNSFSDKNVIYNEWFVGTIKIMGLLVIFIEISIFNFLQSFFYRKDFIGFLIRNPFIGLIVIVIAILLGILINHAVFYRNDKYKRYFALFEKFGQKKRIKYFFLAFFIIVLIVLICIYSFMLLFKMK
jgi:hypothetical protein